MLKESQELTSWWSSSKVSSIRTTTTSYQQNRLLHQPICSKQHPSSLQQEKRHKQNQDRNVFGRRRRSLEIRFNERIRNVSKLWICFYDCTSKRMKRIIWKVMKGIFITCPPISWRPHILLLCWFSSSAVTTKPLFQSRYLTTIEDELGSGTCVYLWIDWLLHFVHTRNAKHSAIL